MPKLVPFRSPLGVYYRSPLGVRDEGRSSPCTQHFEFQVTAEAGTIFYVDFKTHYILTKPDGTQETVDSIFTPDAYHYPVEHTSGNNGWYSCIVPLPYLNAVMWHFAGLIMNAMRSPYTINPVTALRFNRCLTSLTTFNGLKTSITELDVRPLPAIKNLSIGGYEEEIFLERIQIANPTLLTLLLSSVKIQILDKSGMPNLEFLEIKKSTALDSLDMSGMQKMGRIIVSDSTVGEALLFNLPRLHILELYRNHSLSVLDIHNDPELSHLYIAHCAIELLNCASLDSLYLISISDCPSFRGINLDNCPELYQVSISNCSNFKNLLRLNSPVFQYLTIADCPSVTSVNISNLPKLNRLVITGTSITTIDLSDMEDTAFNYVDVSHNALTHIELGPYRYSINAEYNNLSQAECGNLISTLYAYCQDHPYSGGLYLNGNAKLTPSMAWTLTRGLGDTYGWYWSYSGTEW